MAHKKAKQDEEVAKQKDRKNEIHLYVTTGEEADASLDLDKLIVPCCKSWLLDNMTENVTEELYSPYRDPVKVYACATKLMELLTNPDATKEDLEKAHAVASHKALMNVVAALKKIDEIAKRMECNIQVFKDELVKLAEVNPPCTMKNE